MKNFKPFGIIILLLLLTNVISAQEKNWMDETKQERDARMNWWRDARFGMFIHWGIYSVPAGVYKGKEIKGIGEWIMDHANIPVEEYEKFAKEFNPVKFNADEWVQIASDAGMKYIIITSKHHDGFSMWDSKVSPYNVVKATPFKRDVLKELSVACEKKGMPLGFYYSIMDWHNPDAKGDNFAKYRDNYMIPQIKELLSGRYGNVSVLWFDGEWIKEWTEEQGQALYNMLRDIKPDLIINNRVGKGRKGMEGMNKGEGYAGDFGTPEQKIPSKGLPGVDWESCMTMNDTWGYKTYDHDWKSDKVLIRNLIDIASKGGNFLLNVGPTSEGLIPAASVERLAAMGNWIKINGEAIYSTSASPFDKPDWGRYTTKPGKIYAHIFDWPEDKILKVHAKDYKVSRVYLLSDKNKDLKFEQDGDNLQITLPNEAPDSIASLVAIEYEE